MGDRHELVRVAREFERETRICYCHRQKTRTQYAFLCSRVTRERIPYRPEDQGREHAE